MTGEIVKTLLRDHETTWIRFTVNGLSHRVDKRPCDLMQQGWITSCGRWVDEPAEVLQGAAVLGRCKSCEHIYNSRNGR